LKHAYDFQRGFSWSHATLFRVKIKVSKDDHLWVDNFHMRSNALPPGTILADEFEILWEVK